MGEPWSGRGTENKILLRTGQYAMAKTTKNRRLVRAFILNEDAIGRIWDVMSQSNGKPIVTFYCSDDTTVVSDDLQTILHFPNSKLRQIVRTTFELPLSSKQYIMVDFDPNYR